jgi:hypothetical protein
LSDDEILPSAARRKISLEEQADVVRKIANRCALSNGSCSAETLLVLNSEDGDALTAAACTLEAIVPVKEAVRRVVYNEQQKTRRR